MMFTSFVIGFAADLIIVGSPMGPHMLGFGVVGSLLAQGNRLLAVRKIPYQMMTIFVVGLLAGGLVQLLAFLKTETVIRQVVWIVFAQSLYSSIAGPFLFGILAWWMRISRKRYRRF